MEKTSLQEAEELLKKAEKEKVEKCSREIEAVLIKHNCTMIPQIVLRGGQIIPQVLIVSNKQNASMLNAIHKE